MFDIISKSNYFEWIEKGFATSSNTSIKKVHDAFIFSQIEGKNGKKVSEIGSGQSRVLKILSKGNERLNIDLFEDIGKGPLEYMTKLNIKIIKAYAGEFCTEIPSDNFDYVISISVIEHVNPDILSSFFIDTTRMLVKNGLSIHAIDVYLGDHVRSRKNPQIDQYIAITSKINMGLELKDPPARENSNTIFRSHYASNSDDSTYSWNKISPGPFCEIRKTCQCVSIKAILERVA